MQRPNVARTAYVAASAVLVGEVILDEEASVWPGAIIRADLSMVRIGARSNVQDTAVLHSDPGRPCIVGERVTVGHAAVLHGCTVDDDCLIGIGAIVLNGAVIGQGSVVAAGALVPENAAIPESSLVMGIPARVVAIEGPELPARIDASWRAYVRLAQQAKGATDTSALESDAP